MIQELASYISPVCSVLYTCSFPHDALGGWESKVPLGAALIGHTERQFQVSGKSIMLSVT